LPQGARLRAAPQGFAADALQRPLRSRFRQQLKAGVEMICMATACANNWVWQILLAQALSTSSDLLMCTQGKP